MPQAQTAGGYVFDPATNTYYQLPATPIIAGIYLSSERLLLFWITFQ